MEKKHDFKVIVDTLLKTKGNQSTAIGCDTNQQLQDLTKCVENNAREIESLRKQLKKSTKTSKIESLVTFCTEIKNIFSLSGHSQYLETASVFKKLLWFVSMTTLFVSCMYIVNRNYLDYHQFHVVTEIKRVERSSFNFPAVTLCLAGIDLQTQELVSYQLDGRIRRCYLDTVENKCTINDFEPYTLYNRFLDLNYSCYIFNGGHRGKDVLNSTKHGIYTGLVLEVDLELGWIEYFVGDNNVRPITSEFKGVVQPRHQYRIRISKLIDIKLGEPFNPCHKTIDENMSPLVKRVLDSGMRYRQTNCFDQCYDDHLAAYAIDKNISMRDAFNQLNFMYDVECASTVCPLECDSVEYELMATQNQYYSLCMNFFFNDRKETEIFQLQKTTLTDLIAGTGGVLGLFLNLSFISAYKLLIFCYDLVFKGIKKILIH